MALASARLSNNVRLDEAAKDKNRPLAEGEKGRAVELLQHCLVDLGLTMPVSTRPSGLTDGIFGKETAATVKKFQTLNGLKVDGMAGPQTLQRLDVIFQERERLADLQLRAKLNAPAPISPWHVT
jgi:murein L,D-transpeptidase YcbB/YkuD